jgi:5-methylcytosine-specific restriction endonuclease McrBC GTP-binding regulatory subunit McrB
MSSLAKNVTREQVETALFHIIENNITLNSSTRWYLNFKGNNYPPKEVVRWAARLANIPNWESMTLSGGDNTNGPLKALGFSIIEKNVEPFQQLINDYKIHLSKRGLKQELYKWELVQEFKGRPDVIKENFEEEIREINFANLVYGVGIGVIRDLAKQKTEQYRECYISLFDGNVDLQQRIVTFNLEVGKLFKELYPDTTRSHHHDERTIASILTYYDPEKYGFYKDSFYQLLCQKIGQKPKAKNEKYCHYLSIMDDFIADYLQPDTDLLRQVKSLKSDASYSDENLRILAQDIFYVTLESQARTFKNIISEVQIALKNDFDTEPITILQKASYRKKRSWVWACDSKGILSEPSAHYEVEYHDDGNINVCLHFEAAVTNQLFRKGFSEKLPDPLEWFEWLGGESIRFIQSINLTDENIVTELIDRLVYLDEHIGPLVKNIKMGIEEPSTPEDKIQKSAAPLNQILYGPPGTGKTYHTVNKALEIIGEDVTGQSRKAIKKLFDDNITAGRIAFTTFHQSMSYEDFVEGIKPITPQDGDTYVKYETQNGIFKRMCLAAQTPNYSEFNIAFEKLVESLSDQQQLILKTPTNKDFAVSLNGQGNLNLHTGPEKKKNGVLTKDNIELLLNNEMGINEWKGYFYGVVEHLKSQFNYSATPTTKANNNYVLIIDEINRGNVSQIFGELITLIEDSKRIGNDEALKVTLPYSKFEFGVPNNLYIIGTMNTADRSVEALDTALRRRFSFEEMPPQPNLLNPNYRLWKLLHDSDTTNWNEDNFVKKEKRLLDFQNAGAELSTNRIELYEKLKNEIVDLSQVLKLPLIYFNGLDLSKLLTVINERITYLLDNDHQIGHSFFINVYSWEDLRDTFYQNIIPLLQEYFYSDIGKIELILGSGFISVSSDLVVFAVNNSDYDLDEKKTYSIRRYQNDIEGFKIAIFNLLPQ